MKLDELTKQVLPQADTASVDQVQAPQKTSGISLQELTGKSGTPEVPKQEPGFFSKVGSFLKDELISGKGGDVSQLPTGTQTIGSVLQSTLGSKGALGFGKVLPQAVMSGTYREAGTKLEESRKGLADSAMSLIQKANTEVDPTKKQSLLKQAKDTLAQTETLSTAKEGLATEGGGTPEEIQRRIGETAINTALTAATGGKKGLGSGAAAKSVLTKVGVPEAITAYGRSVLPRAIEQGAVGAGFNIASNIGQGKRFGENTLSSALIGSLFPVAGLGLSTAKSAVASNLSKLGVGLENTFLKATPKMFAYGKNPGEGMLKEGITFNSFDEGIQKVDDAITSRINEAKALSAKAGPKGIILSDVLTPLQTALSDAKKAPQTNSALITRLEGAMSDIKGQLGDVNKYHTVDEALDLKRFIGSITKFTGNASDDKTLNSALKRIYGSLMEKTEKAVPGLGEVNGRIADLITAKTALENRGLATEAGKVLKFGTSAARMGGLIYGAATLNPVIIASSLAEYGAEKAFESPAVRSRVANWLYKAKPNELQEVASNTPLLKGIIDKIFGTKEKLPEKQIEQELLFLSSPNKPSNVIPLKGEVPYTGDRPILPPKK